MQQVEIVSEFIKNFVRSAILEGLLILLTGILILIYPKLLSILVACILIASSIVCFVIAAKAHRYSKTEVEL
jgi:Flp pilus assembly protein TadB